MSLFFIKTFCYRGIFSISGFVYLSHFYVRGVSFRLERGELDDETMYKMYKLYTDYTSMYCPC